MNASDLLTRSSDGTHEVQVNAELASSIRRLLVETWSFAVAYRRKENRALQTRGRLYLSSIILSAVVGTSIYVSLATSVQTWAKWLVGAVSLLVAVLSVLNERGGYGAAASQSQAAAETYSILRDDVEKLLNRYSTGRMDSSKAEEKLEKLHIRNDEVNDKTPSIGRKEYEEANDWVISELKRLSLIDWRIARTLCYWTLAEWRDPRESITSDTPSSERRQASPQELGDTERLR